MRENQPRADHNGVDQRRRTSRSSLNENSSHIIDKMSHLKTSTARVMSSSDSLMGLPQSSDSRRANA